MSYIARAIIFIAEIIIGIIFLFEENKKAIVAEWICMCLLASTQFFI